ncbi:MAG: YeeE/YedE family protein [Rhizobiales bacterium]|nr:YeeE/YedE family protein [Hyphomicrobiales bacterium]
MTNFTPVSALFGGALIGFASALLMLLTGRIAGISGIVGGCIVSGASDRNWRLAFIAGLVVAPLIGVLAGAPLPLPQIPSNWTVIVGAGLLVGFGSRLGGGCTSGHGVCGIARLSPRSIVATIAFMTTAMAVVFLVRHGS